MDTSTRLSGHGLLAEGKPFRLNKETGMYERAAFGREGSGLCSCGAVGPWQYRDADRRRWHRRHKEEVRAEASQ